MTGLLLKLKTLLAALITYELGRQGKKLTQATLANLDSNRRRGESIKDALDVREQERRVAVDTYNRKIERIHQFENTQRTSNNTRANKAAKSMTQLQA